MSLLIDVLHSKLIVLATYSTRHSNCVKRKVGAVWFVSGLTYAGWNHSPSGACECAQGKTKPDVVHAEADAINRALRGLCGGVLYVTYRPCIECAKLIVSRGIKTVFYGDDGASEKCGLDYLRANDVQVVKEPRLV